MAGAVLFMMVVGVLPLGKDGQPLLDCTSFANMSRSDADRERHEAAIAGVSLVDAIQPSLKRSRAVYFAHEDESDAEPVPLGFGVRHVRQCVPVRSNVKPDSDTDVDDAASWAVVNSPAREPTRRNWGLRFSP